MHTNDRRIHPRHEVSEDVFVELRVEAGGEKPAMLLRRGLLSDISLSGLLCDITLDVPTGTQVDVRFPYTAPDALEPGALSGRVVRRVSVAGVPAQLAIAFAEPLGRLDAEAIQHTEAAGGHRGRSAAMRRASWADEPQVFPTFATGSLI